MFVTNDQHEVLRSFIRDRNWDVVIEVVKLPPPPRTQHFQGFIDCPE